MLRANQLDVDRAFILVVDFQLKLLPFIRHNERVTSRVCTLLDAARVFDLPVLAAEQNPKGLGKTHQAVQAGLEASRATFLEKSTFSVWGEPSAREAILAVDRPQVVIVGIEAHVCVQQTALDLLSRDYEVFVCADAIGSRSLIDCQTAVERMRQDGALIMTVESALFELCQRCDTKQFKKLLEVIKAALPVDD